MNFGSQLKGFGYYIIGTLKKPFSYASTAPKDINDEQKAPIYPDTTNPVQKPSAKPGESETIMLYELVRQRTVLLGIYSNYPSIETDRQITELNERIKRISPDFPLSEPTIHIPSVIGQKYKKAMFWLAKNSGIILLALTVASVGGVIGVTIYSGKEIKKYRNDIATVNNELKETKAAAKEYKDLVNSWRGDINSLGDDVDEALTNLDNAKEFFVAEIQSITNPLKGNISGLEKKIGESNEKIAELECLIGESDATISSKTAEFDARLLAAASSQYAQYNALYAEISKLNKESMDYRVQARTELEEKLNALKGEINTGIQAQLDELKSSLEQLEGRKISAEEFNKKMNQSKSELDEIKKALNSLKSESPEK